MDPDRELLDRELEQWLAELRDEPVPLEPDFAARLAASAPAARRSGRRRIEWMPLGAMPIGAALAGLAVGLSNPALIRDVAPWDAAADAEIYTTFAAEWDDLGGGSE
ncbi:hypothetical protein [Jannaschia aquimarina]|uniref:Uncharacterized protein n=1 Tax=Jannaschia aquimarina TaxID=935700 RepID=A0A0D1CQ86_9RHOB|nr:hypothetical protein [Jannaschia aquimarina]KIT16917.1 hypothetical protein jaqu_14160 [Jannaschia aquimarina]SNT11656.1 hypothetical protein SAMN05421775_10632 [Jannaschia aquimarina]